MSGFSSQFFTFDEISFRPSGIMDAHAELHLHTLHVQGVVLSLLELTWSCITIATENPFVIFASPGLQCLCSCSKKPARHHEWCLFTCYCSCVLFFADWKLLGFCGSDVIIKMSWPSIRYLLFVLISWHFIIKEWRMYSPEGNQKLLFTVVDLKLSPLSLELRFTSNKSSRLNLCGVQKLSLSCNSVKAWQDC